MENTIFNVYVPIESQEQCNRFKKLCLDNNLDTWLHPKSFSFVSNGGNYFCSHPLDKQFTIMTSAPLNKTKVTESEFIDLLKKYKL